MSIMQELYNEVNMRLTELSVISFKDWVEYQRPSWGMFSKPPRNKADIRGMSSLGDMERTHLCVRYLRYIKQIQLTSESWVKIYNPSDPHYIKFVKPLMNKLSNINSSASLMTPTDLLRNLLIRTFDY